MLFEEEYEKMGEAEVRKGLLLPENSNVFFFKEAPAWLAHKEAERIARSEAREEETLSIAREANTIALSAAVSASDANDIARFARKIAAISAIAAIVAAIAAIKWR